FTGLFNRNPLYIGSAKRGLHDLCGIRTKQCKIKINVLKTMMIANVQNDRLTGVKLYPVSINNISLCGKSVSSNTGWVSSHVTTERHWIGRRLDVGYIRRVRIVDVIVNQGIDRDLNSAR